MNGSQVEKTMTLENAKALISLHGQRKHEIMAAATQLGFAMGGKEAWAQATAEVEEELNYPRVAFRRPCVWSASYPEE